MQCKDEKCPECGQKIPPTPCDECGGKGQHSEIKHDGERFSSYGVRRCERCMGTGVWPPDFRYNTPMFFSGENAVIDTALT